MGKAVFGIETCHIHKMLVVPRRTTLVAVIIEALVVLVGFMAPLVEGLVVDLHQIIVDLDKIFMYLPVIVVVTIEVTVDETGKTDINHVVPPTEKRKKRIK